MAGELLYPLVLLGLCVLGLLAWILYLIFGPSQYDGSPAGSGTGLVSAHVLVLGDIGRSPRMTYHALSIAKHGGKVNLIGYLETSPHPDIVNNLNITITPIAAPPRKPDSLPFLLFAPWKVLYQVYHLFFLLAYRLEPAQWILVQNPPSIPTLAIAALICQLRNSKLMIDWHNYGWSILASTRGSNHPLVRVSKLYECLFGRLGSFHLTVTHAMARQLRRAPYSIKREMLPVHDRPAAIFRPVTSSSARESILHRVLPAEKDLIPGILKGTTRLIVSSTSWTPDEDFSILLDALARYAAQPLTPILAVITGKGPQKEMYLAKIAQLTQAGLLPNVRIITAFLPFPDYAALLACADLGICLHMSSSGVDLPMKVVDMFGAGLPVAAFSGYESFGELVKEGSNGRGFETAEELAGILGTLLSPEGQAELETLKRGAIREGSRRWDEEWDAKVGVIMGLTS
ncbi:glycosyl transferases group 1-domain-containing protein [Podospora aff. communis PSN243]|uniref:Chitobiosyldiphosphodolichol beta-mannosyltransferase n=1 Tax=Podospora aff. communis PSN243 TaxID=3040156 RepID=A0AAV9G7A7_9PEZI|nr:glycosyl transferases group 1-domain-containing protein [Podospora aff. communis PSN243]